ncbi:hypothetical protein D9M68_863500 [compost metagenome]
MGRAVAVELQREPAFRRQEKPADCKFPISGEWGPWSAGPAALGRASQIRRFACLRQCRHIRERRRYPRTADFRGAACLRAIHLALLFDAAHGDRQAQYLAGLDEAGEQRNAALAAVGRPDGGKIDGHLVGLQFGNQVQRQG